MSFKKGEKLKLLSPVSHLHEFAGTVVRANPLTLGEMTVNGEQMYRNPSKTYTPKHPNTWERA